jgi:hypothetical protein
LSALLADDFQFRSAGNDLIDKPGFVKTATSVQGTILSITSDSMGVRLYGEMAVLTGTQTNRPLSGCCFSRTTLICAIR